MINQPARIPVKPLILTFFLFTARLLAAQDTAIEVRFLGNCGLFLTDGRINLYVDFPYKSGAYGYMTYSPGVLDSLAPHAIYLFTHGHADHYSRKLFKKTNQKLYGPWQVRFMMSKKRKYTLKELNDTLPGFFITEYRTKHGKSLKHMSYLLEWDGKRIFINGDAYLADTLVSIKNLDVVFAPSWVIRNAKERDLKIDAKKIVVYHHPYMQSVTTTNPKILIPAQNQVIMVK